MCLWEVRVFAESVCVCGKCVCISFLSSGPEGRVRLTFGFLLNKNPAALPTLGLLAIPSGIIAPAASLAFLCAPLSFLKTSFIFPAMTSMKSISFPSSSVVLSSSADSMNTIPASFLTSAVSLSIGLMIMVLASLLNTQLPTLKIKTTNSVRNMFIILTSLSNSWSSNIATIELGSSSAAAETPAVYLVMTVFLLSS